MSAGHGVNNKEKDVGSDWKHKKVGGRGGRHVSRASWWANAEK